ncbi:hypothetical protein [Vibrio phage BONAISHI]|nr:hypothetical protein [Vibrio phage BONAISHI]
MIPKDKEEPSFLKLVFSQWSWRNDKKSLAVMTVFILFSMALWIGSDFYLHSELLPLHVYGSIAGTFLMCMLAGYHFLKLLIMMLGFAAIKLVLFFSRFEGERDAYRAMVRDSVIPMLTIRK